MSAHQPPWSYPVLKAVADVLADTADGLTGREIGDLLTRLRMEDPLSTTTKRDRLAEAFVTLAEQGSELEAHHYLHRDGNGAREVAEQS